MNIAQLIAALQAHVAQHGDGILVFPDPNSDEHVLQVTNLTLIGYEDDCDTLRISDDEDQSSPALLLCALSLTPKSPEDEPTECRVCGTNLYEDNRELCEEDLCCDCADDEREEEG